MNNDNEFGIANLLIAGASKAGTSSLFSYLSHHPDICPADIKEVRYFDAYRYGWNIDPIDVYACRWRRCGDERYFMEATPGYLYGSRWMVGKIKQTCPDGTRVVVSLRDPVDRMWSYYRFVRNRTRIPKGMTFTDYIAECERATMDDDPDSPYRALRGGCYATYLPNWFDVFGDDVRVVFFDDLVAAPDEVYADLLKWLDLPYHVTDTTPENVTAGFRLWWLQRIAVKVNRAGGRFFSPGFKRAARSVYYRINRGAMPRQMPGQDRAVLEAFYAPANQALAGLLAGRDLALPPSFGVGEPVSAPRAQVA